MLMLLHSSRRWGHGVARCCLFMTMTFAMVQIKGSSWPYALNTSSEYGECCRVMSSLLFPRGLSRFGRGRCHVWVYTAATNDYSFHRPIIHCFVNKSVRRFWKMSITPNPSGSQQNSPKSEDSNAQMFICSSLVNCDKGKQCYCCYKLFFSAHR